MVFFVLGSNCNSKMMEVYKIQCLYIYFLHTKEHHNFECMINRAYNTRGLTFLHTMLLQWFCFPLCVGYASAQQDEKIIQLDMIVSKNASSVYLCFEGFKIEISAFWIPISLSIYFLNTVLGKLLDDKSIFMRRFFWEFQLNSLKI